MKTKLSIAAIALVSVTYLGFKKVEACNAAPTPTAIATLTTNNIAPLTNLAYFSTQQLGRDFQLTWATNSEQKDTRLELEKSFNERQFETLAVFKGADRNTLKTYAYVDTTPFEKTAHEVKIIYYRLKEVDANQIYTYSKVVTIVRDDNEDVSKPVF